MFFFFQINIIFIKKLISNYLLSSVGNQSFNKLGNDNLWIDVIHNASLMLIIHAEYAYLFTWSELSGPLF